MKLEQYPQAKHSVFRRRLPFEVASSIAIFALIYYALRTVDFELLWLHLSSLVDKYILYGLTFSALVFIGHGLRLRLLIGSDFLTSYQIVNLGSVLNVVLPFRLGDLARIYLSRRYFDISAAKLLAAVLVEKFFDLAVVLLLATVALLSGAVKLIPVSLVIVSTGVMVGLYSAYLILQRAAWLDSLFEMLPRRIGDRINVLRGHLSISNAPMIGLWTAFIWLINIACTLAMFRILLPDSDFGQADAITLTVITALAVAIPGAPAGMGIFEAGIVAYLMQVHHISGELALACALIFHAVIVIPPLAGVLLGMIRRLV